MIVFLFSRGSSCHSSGVFESATLKRECVTSTNLQIQGQQFSDSNEDLGHDGVVTDSMTLNGCGCFIVFEGPFKTGRGYFIDRKGEHKFHLMRIRSIYKVKCPKTANTVLYVATLTVATVLLVGVIALFVKKYKERRYQEVQLEVI